MPVDPWSLGPDVFALASQSSESHGDTVSQEPVPTPNFSEPTVAIDSPLPSRKIVVPVASSSEPSLPTVTPLAEPLSSFISSSDTFYTVQLGTFLDRNKAQEFYDKASSVLGMTGSIQGDWPFFRLRFGEFPARVSADSLHRVAMSRGFYDARVLRITPPQ